MQLLRQQMLTTQKRLELSTFAVTGRTNISTFPSVSCQISCPLDQAEQRVRLGLQISAIVEKEKITSTDDQIKALADNIAKSYEDPKEVVDWYLNNPQHKAELAAVVVENNVVAWVLKNAQVKKEPISFENLMGRGQQA